MSAKLRSPNAAAAASNAERGNGSASASPHIQSTSARQSEVPRAAAALAQHRPVRVAHDDAATVAGEAERHVPRAASDVEHPGAGRRAELRHEGAPPQAVDAEAHQVVHRVVAPGDRGEHARHQPPPGVGVRAVRAVP